MVKTKAAGLCASCKFDPGCIYESGSGVAILQCEQFEMGAPRQTVRPASTQSRSVPGYAKDRNGYAGLCANCDNQVECTYPKPEGGVWRCEEYV
jgi:hypothetical protein